MFGFGALTFQVSRIVIGSINAREDVDTTRYLLRPEGPAFNSHVRKGVVYKHSPSSGGPNGPAPSRFVEQQG